jgi:lipoprotein-anchoring transpeptidase ErfK/SrfK
MPFSILVDKSQNILILKSNEEVIKTYIVSTGANNSTPTGTFKIINKIPHPTWFKAGAVVPAGTPDNILGTRWLGFDLPGYGIHGTTEPQSLGQQVTQGCVRMANLEVEELYTIIPVGTEVTIID